MPKYWIPIFSIFSHDTFQAEEARIAKEVEAHEKRIRKEMEKQDIMRRKVSPQLIILPFCILYFADKCIHYSVERRTNEERDGTARSGTAEGGGKTVA